MIKRKYKIIVDKQPRTNPSNESREYEIDIEELRCKGNIADSLIITKDEDYVMRRLLLNEYHVLSVLPEPVKEPLQDINIELFEGENYVYIQDMVGNKFYAEYLVKNDFTDMYVTVNQMNSAINQTAEKIELSVTKTLEGYATTEKMNSKITQTAEEINSEVSKKVGNDEIISKINQSAEKVIINADKINIDGKAVHFSTEITQTFGHFTQQDAERIRKILMGEITPTSADYEKYDINGDKEIDSSDWLRVSKAVQTGNGYFTEKGTFMIDPYSAQKSIKIYRNTNNLNVPTAILSVITNFFNEINVGGTINFAKNEDGTSAYINSQGISLTSQTSGQNAFFGTMENEGEISGYFSIGSSHGSIYGQIGTTDGGTILLNKYNSLDELTQTIIKATGITTPVLTQTSQEENKKNFEKLENGLDIVKATDIYKYNLKDEEDTKKKHIGFVIGKDYKYAHEITAEDNEGKEIGVDIYSMVSVLWKAVQEQQEQIEAMQKEINQLKEVQNGEN